MLIAFLIVSLIIGMFFSIIWNTTTAANVLVKMAFIAYTVWAAFMLLATTGATVTFANGMRLL